MQWNDIQGLMLMASLPMLVCLQWTVVLLIDWLRGRKTVQWRMLTFMATATLLYLGHYIYFTHLEALLPMANIVYRVCNLLVYPLYLLYIGELTRGGLDTRTTWLWLLPAVVGGGLFAAAFLSGETAWISWASMLCRTLFAVLVVTVCWQGLRLLRGFRRTVKNIYADIEGRTLRPISVVLVLLTVVSAASFVANIIGRDNITPSAWALAIPSVLFSSLLFCIGYIGHQPIFSWTDIKEHSGNQELLEDNGDAEDAPFDKLEELAQQVEQLMGREKMYLKHDLHVTDVAKVLGTNEKYVSQAINRALGLNFSDYVNNKRVAYARELQKKNPELLASEIANLSGFKSMSSYYRNLRRIQQ